ncbi:hypothetical protein SDC9_168983 [bioreactor metagenome]|uniref:Uncharacterized protein n=1 Tax=bioreactor metagenome TaxID=1076179 RepID=A0A645GCL5_9ZZZZ
MAKLIIIHLRSPYIPCLGYKPYHYSICIGKGNATEVIKIVMNSYKRIIIECAKLNNVQERGNK